MFLNQNMCKVPFAIIKGSEKTWRKIRKEPVAVCGC